MLIQHRDAVREREHAIDVVLNQQHGVTPGKIADKRADAFAIGIAEPGERLVQQRQVRVGGKRENFLSGWRSTPGTSAATSHLDWLISITAMIVPSCSREVRDLLASK
jgi:hypothetical protein